MERVDQPNDNNKQDFNSNQSNRNQAFFSGNSAVGIVVIVAGVAWLLARMGYDFIPHWFFTWPMILVAVGFISAIKHGFRNPGSYITMLIGGAFLLRNNFDIPYEYKTYFWPIIVIIAGVMLLMRPRKKNCGPRHRRFKHRHGKFDASYTDSNKTIFDSQEGVVDSSPVMDSVTIFGGAEREIIAKDFAGGSCTVVFGGNQINFAKADLAADATLDLAVIFGGVKMIVPPHWDVQINTSNIAGGVDDKRRKDSTVAEYTKTLYLTGAIVFGGLEIKSSNQF